MDRYLRATFITLGITALLVWAILATGCTSQPFMKVVRLPPPTVIIVMDRPGEWAIKDKNGTAAIFVEGEMINGKILPNRRVLAHEIMHLMNWEDKAFLNPDGE